MERWAIPIVAAALLFAAPASAQVATPGAVLPAVVPATTDTLDPAAPLTEEALLAFGSSQSRMTVPVSIATRGPWPFVIDTGAERTVVSRELAHVLGLEAGPQVRVTAMTGTETVGSVIVPSLSVSLISRATIEAPALRANDLGAVGMLGVDALQGHSVAIDFDRHRMMLKPSKKRRSHLASVPGEVVVVAKSLYGQLIVTNAYWRKTQIAVIIDTGSSVTVGNHALLAALTRRPQALGPLEMISATGQVLRADAFVVDKLTVGGIGIDNVRIAFSDAPPFARFGLAERPALLVGMDVLRLFRAVDIDFANREIRFQFPRPDPTAQFGIGV